MRTARVLAGAVLTIAVAGLPCAPAFAGDFEKLEIEPSAATSGATVTVSTLACGKQGVGTGDASAVGGPSAFQLKPETHKELVIGQFKIPDVAKAGTYGIGVKCKNGKEATGDVVVGTGGSGKPSAAPSMPGKAVSPPKGPVKTGAGGTSEGSGTSEIIAGAAVLATAAVGGTLFLRRRSGGGRA
ncbi:hypothetical protein I5Q34_13610 [Streptomyces sp. AV19]|uniref:hypothetical protein n=1 Tax=Streptomyces sp. AV19 TaxID=2793068 RepID=UPI0018FF06D4|nr:hypothetical protein [Streptomyces sp. AV19]MBH1935297.1 hypothetical protein [Streptomyces sp. AV19]MDG4531183.1 hypothetical protein [Streptomyces sp. AV19]